MLKKIDLRHFILSNGKSFPVPLSYEVFGLPLGAAPIVLVNHALTGNSSVAGKKGWWTQLVGNGKIIDTNRYTILCFNIPGNGYDGFFVENPLDITIKDVARMFLEGLENIGAKKLHSIIGASLGGSLAWEIAFLKPDIARQLIPIASDYIASDWLLAHTYLQQRILEHSSHPIEDARVHAMMMYRSAASINNRFKREKAEKNGLFQVEDWLDYHGKSLNNRFTLLSYKYMNQLIKTIKTTDNPSDLLRISADIHLVAIQSDIYFTAERNQATYNMLKKQKPNVFYHEIASTHGHDAFLIEYEKLNHILSPLF